MNFDSIQPFIINTEEDGYHLELWQTMLKSWGLETVNNAKDKEIEQFLSKMMEFQRACVDEGDKQPVVIMKKDFKECMITLQKHDGTEITYILNPYGFQEQWEIFRVIKS